MPSRRAVLGAVGVAAVGSLGGCSRLSSDAERVGLTVFNQTDATYTVEIGFFDDDTPEPAARAYESALDVAPGGEATRDAVAEVGRYLVRYRAYEDGSRLTDQGHVHFVPDGDGSERLTFDVREPGVLASR
ncbi:hypothetical protein EXE44_14240 [Halorubrum sp. SS7]|uniref:hypothetical protein n=1 Tax=Halorubrum sp. SS7 TaxID=2518119 RepID=UPI0010F5D626|nr:hypothetical protein [Halorubrum sp. SS7]TKX56538.1 hypothetical protein EXE44_14240 [Halorubrum sp. SS7]